MNLKKSDPINIPKTRVCHEYADDGILMVPPEPSLGRIINSYDTVDTRPFDSPDSIQRVGTPIPSRHTPNGSHTPFNQVPLSPVPIHCGWNPRPFLQKELICRGGGTGGTGGGTGADGTCNGTDWYQPVDDPTIVTFSGYQTQPYQDPPSF